MAIYVFRAPTENGGLLPDGVRTVVWMMAAGFVDKTLKGLPIRPTCRSSCQLATKQSDGGGAWLHHPAIAAAARVRVIAYKSSRSKRRVRRNSVDLAWQLRVRDTIIGRSKQMLDRPIFSRPRLNESPVPPPRHGTHDGSVRLTSIGAAFQPVACTGCALIHIVALACAVLNLACRTRPSWRSGPTPLPAAGAPRPL